MNDEHLISPGCGGEIEAIETHRAFLERAHRMSCSDPSDPNRSTTYGESAKAISYLLALVREQAAKLKVVREVHAPEPAAGRDGEGVTFCCTACSTYWPCPTIAALELKP